MKRPTSAAERAANIAAVMVSLSPVRPAVLIVLVIVLGWLAGCATSPQLVPVKVSVPVECRVDKPQRPAMPFSDAPAPAAALDSHVAAMLAEIELRDGYELQLVAALETCTAPLPSAPP
ncbi:MAG TPA: hypothetical protein VIL30_06295 [Ramlibacter sp.]|jgi:hypothetical protein